MDRTHVTEFVRESLKVECNPATVVRDNNSTYDELKQAIHCELQWIELQDTEIPDLKKEEICKLFTLLEIMSHLTQ